MSKQHTRLNRAAWEKARKAALIRDGYRCRNCGKAGRLEVDHIVPLEKKGAAYDLANLRTLCRSCHIKITYESRPYPVQGKTDWIDYLSEFTQGG